MLRDMLVVLVKNIIWWKNIVVISNSFVHSFEVRLMSMFLSKNLPVWIILSQPVLAQVGFVDRKALRCPLMNYMQRLWDGHSCSFTVFNVICLLSLPCVMLMAISSYLPIFVDIYMRYYWHRNISEFCKKNPKSCLFWANLFLWLNGFYLSLLDLYYMS